LYCGDGQLSTPNDDGVNEVCEADENGNIIAGACNGVGETCG
jgi:hypothetical protein